jgi:hypothetical protein
VAKPNYESKKRLKSPLQGDKIKTKSSFVKNLIPSSLFPSYKKTISHREKTRRTAGGKTKKQSTFKCSMSHLIPFSLFPPVKK